jgi:hypothetical protein
MSTRILLLTGASSHSEWGGDGGKVRITGGMSKGTNVDAQGGFVELKGGTAVAGYGGSVHVTSGVGIATSSGSMVLETANAGSYGASGSMELRTGGCLLYSLRAPTCVQRPIFAFLKQPFAWPFCS